MRPRTPYPDRVTVHALFEAQAARTPDAVAVQGSDGTLTYAALDARANRLAHRLRALGVERETLVGISLERTTHMVVAMLAVMKAGGAYVPLDPAFPRDRLAYMAEDAAVRVIVTERALAGGFSGATLVLVDDDGAEHATDDAADVPLPVDPSRDADARSLAYVIYTSGSTGKPKGVQLEHRSVVNFLFAMHAEPGIGADDRLLAITTLSFDIAGLELLGPLTTGGTTVIASRADTLDGERLARMLQQERITIMQATPATWRLLLDSGWPGQPGLRMLCGGEKLPAELAARLRARGGELWNMYGPTETTIWSTVDRVTDPAQGIALGHPIANTDLFILEPSGAPAPVGVPGELCIGGDGLARGYRNRAELTAEKFVDVELPGVGTRRVYRTGDLVRRRADGRLEFLGRRDEQVKVRGFRIELGEIESVLAGCAGVQACVVVVREDTPGDKRLVGYVVVRPGETWSPDEARAVLRARLPEYMVPNILTTLDALPLTPNGKIDRRALPAPDTRPDPRAEAEAALADATMTPVQRRVARVWRETLQRDHVTLQANFFDSGGHSLLLVQLQSALQREFGVDFPLVELFQRPTIAAQAARFDDGEAGVDEALQRARARALRQASR